MVGAQQPLRRKGRVLHDLLPSPLDGGIHQQRLGAYARPALVLPVATARVARCHRRCRRRRRRRHSLLIRSVGFCGVDEPKDLAEIGRDLGVALIELDICGDTRRYAEVGVDRCRSVEIRGDTRRSAAALVERFVQAESW